MQEIKIFSDYDAVIVTQNATNFIKDKKVISMNTTTTDIGGKPLYTITVVTKNTHHSYLRTNEVSRGVYLKETIVEKVR